MTRAQLLQFTRYIVNELSTEAGALLSDGGNLTMFINEGAEQTVTDIMPYMPMQFLNSEAVSLVADQPDYTLTNEFSQIYKVERNVTNKKPKEIPIIDPLKLTFYHKIGETAAEPKACYFKGDTLYLVPTPSANTSDYLTVWEVVPEPAAIVSTGPTYIPRVAHKMICYWAAYIAATSCDVDPTRYAVLYQKRLDRIKKTWEDRFQQEPRFVNESVADRIVYDDREPYFYDTEWPE